MRSRYPGGVMFKGAVLAALFSGGAAIAGEQADALRIVFPHQWVGNIDRTRFNEPSGVVFHAQRGTLFVVGDEGDVCEIRTDGTMVKQAHLRDGDFEGITCDPSSGLLYIAVEGEEKVIELDPENFRMLREFVIPRTFQGVTLMKAGGQGIEAITFVPDPGHPHGGTFYVANQSFSLEDREDVSALFEVEIPLKSKSAGADPGARIIKCHRLGVIDLGALHFDKQTGLLLVVSDATNTIFELTRTGELLRSFAFPGDNQEGIAVDDNDFLYIAQDSGGIMKIKWHRSK